MARVLVIGGTGFVGAHVVRACLSRGDSVTVIARPASDIWRLADVIDQIDLRRLELTDAPALLACLRACRPEVVHHLGARTRFDPAADLNDFQVGIEENLTPLISLLGAVEVSGVPPRAFVRAGSIAEYGNAQVPHTEPQRETPRNAYAASMLAGTQFLAAAQPRLSFPVVTARLALTYGPAQSRDFLVPSLIDHCLRGETLEVKRPDDRRDLVFVDDVVRALILISERPEEAGEVVNVASGLAPSMRRVAEIVVAATGAANGLVRISAQDPATVVELRSSSDRLRRRLGWAPEIDLETGIARTVDWAREQERGEGAHARMRAGR